MGRQPRTRKRTAQVLTSIEQRRLKLQEEIRALEAQPESPSTTKSLTTKRRLLANVDKERYNWLGLEDEEELGTQHFIKNVQAVIRQRKAGLATAIKGAVGMKILGADPLISNAWAGALMLRDMFRGNNNIEPDAGTAGKPSSIPSSGGGGKGDANLVPDLLARIATTTEKTYDLLDWVYTYRRARFREIMNLDTLSSAAEATVAMNALPPAERQERIASRENSVEDKVTDLIELTKEGLFGSPKLLGPAGPIASLLGKVHEGVLVQGDALKGLEPTEEEARESQMNKLARLNQFSKNKNISNLAALGGTAAGAGGGFLSNIASETVGSFIGTKLGTRGLATAGKAVAGSGAGKAVAGIASKVGAPALGIAAAAATGIIMTALDFTKGWLYKHKEYGTGKVSGALGTALSGTGERGIWSTIGNMSKLGAIGFAAGAPFGPPGMAAGLILGTALGWVFDALGGKKISQWFQSAGKWIQDTLWKGIKQFVIDIKEWIFGPNKPKMPKAEDAYNIEDYGAGGGANQNLDSKKKIGQRIINETAELDSLARTGRQSLPGSANIVTTNSISNNETTNITGRNSSDNPNSPAQNKAVPNLLQRRE